MVPLRLVGLLLTIGLVGWIGWSLSTGRSWRPAPEVLGSGSAFVGNEQLPAAEIREAVDRARGRVCEINQNGRWFSLSGEIAVWLSFACTAAVTLIAGWFGRSPETGGLGPSSGGLPRGPTRAIGLLAGLAAVLTAGGTMATDAGSKRFERAKQAQITVNQSVKAISDASTANEARAALDELSIKIGQL